MESLSKKIKDVVQGIESHLAASPNSPNFISLKNLEDFCNHQLFQSDNAEEQFFCFYISHLLGSFFSNFGGDTPFDSDIHTARINFYIFMSKKLDLLSESIITNKDDSIKILSDMTHHYISTINYLNKS